MLSKLLKYELVATGRIFLPLFIALLIFSGISRLFFSFDLESTPVFISMFIYIAIMAGMFVMTFIMMIQRFNKNLLSDEGYLMLTLPVKPWQHIMSKLLVSMFWIIASIVVAFISIIVIALEENSLIPEITKVLADFHDQAIALFGSWFYLLSFELIIGMLITLASGILIVYASIALGHLFNQHKILASFGAFIVLNTATQIFFMLLGMIPGMTYFADIHISSTSDFISIQPMLHLVIACGIIYTVILCAAYFAVANFILSKRLNLE